MPIVSSAWKSASLWHATGLPLLPPHAAPLVCNSHSLVCQASSALLTCAREIVVVSSCAALTSPFDCNTSCPANCCPAIWTKFESTTPEACCTADGVDGGERI